MNLYHHIHFCYYYKASRTNLFLLLARLIKKSIMTINKY